MSGEYWCEECTEWVESSEVSEDIVVLDETRGDKGTVYRHDLCNSQVTHNEDY